MGSYTTPDPAGLLLVDKPTGWTSHDVVNCVRRRFRLKKVGHCGTLDPNATGLLVLVIGKATKLAQNFSNTDKSYRGVMRLGCETTTQDVEGDVIARKGCPEITETQFESVKAGFVGRIWQVPPMVSAVKKNGKRLYELARKGQTV
ncbi:MAG: tRNA pseudouridine(55) synthase TruB, partial [Lentisphaeria bacterium]